MRSSRQGMALPFALTIVLLLGGMVAAFHQLMMSSQHSTGKFVEDAVLRRIAEAGVNEAWKRVQRAFQDPSTLPGLTDFLRQGGTAAFENVSLPLTATWGTELVKSGTLAVKCRLRVIDERPNDRTGNSYYPGEKVGTLGITVSAVILRGAGKALKTCTIERYHDFKILALLTPASQRNGRYANSFPLDYALLVRNGLKEFEAHEGLSLNPKLQRLRIKQPAGAAKLGKIYFGGTGDTGNGFVFVNIPAEASSLLPQPQQPAGNPPAVILPVIDAEECFRLFPTIKNKYKKYLGKLRGYFFAKVLPVLPPIPAPAVASDPIDRIMFQEFEALAEVATGPGRNSWPGIELLGPWDSPLSPSLVPLCLEGRLRQRFRYAVAFRLDPSQCDQAPDEETKKILESPIPCLPVDTIQKILEGGNLPNTGQTQEILVPFMRRLEQLQAARNPQDWPLISRYQTDFPLLAGAQSTPMPPSGPVFPTPTFVNHQNKPIKDDETTPNGFYAFRHANLWTYRFKNFGELAAYGLYDPQTKILKLSGAMEIYDPDNEGPVILSEDLKFEGQGAILAHSFELRGGLTKTRESDVCILVTRYGPIRIGTDKKIEAGLIANDLATAQQGRLQPATKALHLKGAVCVDVLDTFRWAPGVQHEIEYDPAFRVEQPVYSYFLSPWISFQRQVFET